MNNKTNAVYVLQFPLRNNNKKLCLKVQNVEDMENSLDKRVRKTQVFQDVMHKGQKGKHKDWDANCTLSMLSFTATHFEIICLYLNKMIRTKNI